MVIFYSYVSLPEGKWNDTGILNTAHGDIPSHHPCLPAFSGAAENFRAMKLLVETLNGDWTGDIMG